MDRGYRCWLQFDRIEDPALREAYGRWCGNIVVLEDTPLMRTAQGELTKGIAAMLGRKPVVSGTPQKPFYIALGTVGKTEWIAEVFRDKEAESLHPEGYRIRSIRQGDGGFIVLAGKTDRGVLYAVFHLLRLMQTGKDLDQLDIEERPRNPLRLINHWDNLDGSIERGYAGKSIFYKRNRILPNKRRVTDYARLLASVGINGVAINNVNVHKYETMLITERYLPKVEELADLFREYGIKIFLSINYASPVEIGGLPTADPLDPEVKEWWKKTAAKIYEYIPDFGGFLVKADSEHRPGPFTYGRDHAEGANMLAEALEPFGGIVIWRCFVYNCQQDWRDRSTDRAKAAYDHFKPLDGKFRENVILQIKNGPMDFQVREPVSPLFGAMPKTNQMIEFQITQEYTGQQRHVCYLVPQWKEVLDFDTQVKGPGSTVKSIVDGSLFNYQYCGTAAVSNIGDDPNWTGHHLAQANLYGYGRLAWNPDLSAEEIAEEWIRMTFGHDPQVVETIQWILLRSWPVYEKYTAPLGVGWMVNPGTHYGPNVDGYEYSRWGTYHYADCRGIGVDRTVKTGTGYTAQYAPPVAEMYESLGTCPDELLLFFHHVPYTHKLKSGKTVIQHIYDTHFEGVEEAEEFLEKWKGLKGRIDDERFKHVLQRLEEQVNHAKEWRDVINTYFYRKSGIPDEKNRTIY